MAINQTNREFRIVDLLGETKGKNVDPCAGKVFRFIYETSLYIYVYIHGFVTPSIYKKKHVEYRFKWRARESVNVCPFAQAQGTKRRKRGNTEVIRKFVVRRRGNDWVEEQRERRKSCGEKQTHTGQREERGERRKAETCLTMCAESEDAENDALLPKKVFTCLCVFGYVYTVRRTTPQGNLGAISMYHQTYSKYVSTTYVLWTL